MENFDFRFELDFGFELDGLPLHPSPENKSFTCSGTFLLNTFSWLLFPTVHILMYVKSVQEMSLPPFKIVFTAGNNMNLYIKKP